MELKFKCLTNASPTNSFSQEEDLVPFLVGPKKPQKIERQNTITDESSHNEAVNDPLSPHHSDTCSTCQQKQNSCSSKCHQRVSCPKLRSKQKKKLA